jgi:hypothetical protein
LRGSNGVHSLNVNLDELGQTVLIEIEDEVMHEIADDDKWELVREFHLFKEIFDFLRIVMVTLAADTLDFPNLPCTSRSLDVFEWSSLRLTTDPRQ